MKKRGFTLIELVVVIALIAILAVTLAPRLRDQIAKANDAKAIAALGALRTASEIHYAETNEVTRNVNDNDISKLSSYVDSTVETLIDPTFTTAALKIGGYRAFGSGIAGQIETARTNYNAAVLDDEIDEGPLKIILDNFIADAEAEAKLADVKFSNGNTIPVIIGTDDIGLSFGDTVLSGDGTTEKVSGAIADTKGKIWTVY